jgi:hypothetical protein
LAVLRTHGATTGCAMHCTLSLYLQDVYSLSPPETHHSVLTTCLQGIQNATPSKMALERSRDHLDPAHTAGGDSHRHSPASQKLQSLTHDPVGQKSQASSISSSHAGSAWTKPSQVEHAIVPNLSGSSIKAVPTTKIQHISTGRARSRRLRRLSRVLG